MTKGDIVRLKIKENPAKPIYAEGVVSEVVNEYGHDTYIISDARIIGEIKTRTPIKIKRK